MLSTLAHSAEYAGAYCNPIHQQTSCRLPFSTCRPPEAIPVSRCIIAGDWVPFLYLAAALIHRSHQQASCILPLSTPADILRTATQQTSRHLAYGHAVHQQTSCALPLLTPTHFLRTATQHTSRGCQHQYMGCVAQGVATCTLRTAPATQQRLGTTLQARRRSGAPWATWLRWVPGAASCRRRGRRAPGEPCCRW